MSDSRDELNINEPATASAPSTPPEPKPASAPIDPATEMRAIVIVLFVAVLVISGSFNVYVYKQNGRVQMELENANNQIAQIEQNPVLAQNRSAMQNLLSEVMAQIPAHPEAQQILARYNLQAQPPAAPAPSAPPAKQ